MAGASGDDRPFLSRWSERKRAARDGEAAPAELPETAPEEAPDADTEAVRAENRAAAEAIDLDSLTDRSDYGPFFRPGVPAALKSAALHRLWRSNPVFANLDGLNDYDLDYTFPKGPVGHVKTAWRLGRGFLASPDGPTSEAGVAGPVEAVPGDDVARDLRQPAAEETVRAQDKDEPPEAAGGGEAGDEVAESVAEDDPASETPATPVRVGLAQRVDFAAFSRSEEGN